MNSNDEQDLKKQTTLKDLQNEQNDEKAFEGSSKGEIGENKGNKETDSNQKAFEGSVYKKLMGENESERALKVHQSLENGSFEEKKNSLLAKMLQGKGKIISGPTYSLRPKKRRF